LLPGMERCGLHRHGDLRPPPDAAANHDRRHSLRRDHLCPAEPGVPIRVVDRRAGRGADCPGRRKVCGSLVGTEQRTAGRCAALPLHSRSGERHDLGRPTCLLGHGAGRRHYPLARVPPTRDRRSGASDSVSDSLGVRADPERHVRTTDHLQRNGAGVFHGTHALDDLPPPLARDRSKSCLLQPLVSGLADASNRGGHVDRRLKRGAATRGSTLWRCDRGGRTALLLLLEAKERPVWPAAHGTVNVGADFVNGGTERILNKTIILTSDLTASRTRFPRQGRNERPRGGTYRASLNRSLRSHASG